MVTTSHGPFTPEVSDVYRSFARRVPIIAISHAQAVEASRQGIQVARVIHHGLDPDEVVRWWRRWADVQARLLIGGSPAVDAGEVRIIIERLGQEADR